MKTIFYASRRGRHLALLALAAGACFLCPIGCAVQAEEILSTRARNAVAAHPEGPLFAKVLELNRVQEPELNLDEVRKNFYAAIERARPEVDAARSPREKITALNKVLLLDRKTEYLSNMYWRDATLAASVLRGKGNCLSTATLYLLAGEALNLPIHMVLIPRHAFARWDDGKVRINIETTGGGAELPDSEYLSKWSQPAPDDTEKLGWCKSLSADESMSELLATAAFHRIGENKLNEALELFDEALKLAPQRLDIALRRCETLADIPGKRDEAREKMFKLATGDGAPPSVVTEALMDLAHHAAGSGDHQKEREYLLLAFVKAPKSSQIDVLNELAFCLRALKDYHGAVRYMELAVALDPENADYLYDLAILQHNAGDLKAALQTNRRARKRNPESWFMQIQEAGFIYLLGEKEESLKRFEKIERPRADEEFWEIMQSWFLGVTGQRDKFFKQFEHALDTARSPRILEWIDQDPALDSYRNESEFKALVEKHRERLMGKK